MTQLQTVIDNLEKETKYIQMQLRFETNNQDYEKATGWLAREIKFLRVIDLLKEIKATNTNPENAEKLHLVIKELNSELLECKERKKIAVQHIQTENFASIRDEEKKIEDWIKILNEWEYF